METIVEMIDAVLSDVNNEALIAETRKKVNAMMENRPLFAWQSKTYFKTKSRMSKKAFGFFILRKKILNQKNISTFAKIRV